MRAIFGNRIVLWIAFVLAHLWLGFVNLTATENAFGDVTGVYRHWMDQAFVAHFWVGIDAPWVYPIVAIVPMVVSYAFGPDHYGSTWLSLVFVLDAAALLVLTGVGRRARNLDAGWWWLVFLVVLGPIALGRIDTVSVAVALIGMLLLARHPTAASVLVTVATWIKVWPAALVAAIVIASKHRVAAIASVVGTSVGIVAIALAFGSGTNVLSFVTQQTSRALQIEAPISTFWLWRAKAHLGHTEVSYNSVINTWQVTGHGTILASAAMNPLLALAVVAVALLGIRAMRRRVDVAQLLPLLALALVLCFIVANKVGSPQYQTWLAVPIVLGLTSDAVTRAQFRLPALAALVIAALTQVIYPFFYSSLVALHIKMLLVISLRNLLLVALLAWAVAQLWRAGSRERRETLSMGNNRASD